MELSVEEFTCHICLQPLEDPVNDPCGHSFCRECISSWHKTTQNCPVSKMYFGPERLNPNRLLKLVMEAHLTKCINSNKGCSWVGRFRELEKEHRQNCKMDEFPETSLKSLVELLKEPNTKIYRFEIENGEIAGIKKEDQETFPGTIKYVNGDYFEGILKDNKRQGAGRFQNNSDKTLTEGYWQNDLKNGYACIFKDQIIIFEGFFANDVPEGDCIIRVESGVIKAKFTEGSADGDAHITFKTGGEYTGLINEEYIPHGRGSLLQSDGTMTIAEFDKGVPSGEHEIIYSDGSNFKGIFDLETNVHNGTMTYTNKDTFTGELKNKKKHGKGKLVMNKEVYEGTFQEDKMHGDMKITYVDNSIFEGKFDMGVAKGLATKTFANGIVVTGNCDGYTSISGPGKVKLVDGTVLEGNILYPHNVNGKGTITLPNGNVISGNINNNKVSGAGEIKYSNGSVYKGTLKDNHPEGKGVLTSEEGKYSGDWTNGMMNGRIEFKSPAGKLEIIIYRMGKRAEPVKAQKPSTAKLMDSKDHVPAPKTPPLPKVEHKDIKKERVQTAGNEKVKVARPTIAQTPRWN